MATRLVALKLTETEYAAVKEMLDRGYYESASAVLRDGLMMLLNERGVKRDTLDQIKVERIAAPMRKRRRTEEEEST